MPMKNNPKKRVIPWPFSLDFFYCSISMLNYDKNMKKSKAQIFCKFFVRRSLLNSINKVLIDTILIFKILIKFYGMLYQNYEGFQKSLINLPNEKLFKVFNLFWIGFDSVMFQVHTC